jgi:hypothetical protein
MSTSVCLTEALGRSTVYYYKHFTYINFTATMVVCIGCAVIAGFLLEKLKKD